MANIVLVDDHHLILESIPLLIEKVTEHKVTNTFDNPINALDFIKKNADEIDLVITDMKMEEMNGVKFVKAIKEDLPDQKIIVISQYDLKEFVVQSIQLGALGYCLKNIRSKELAYAIDKVLKGEMYLCNRSLRIMINAQKEQDLNINLTPREKEILLFIAQGKTSKEISLSLDLEIPTVSFHRRNIMQKIDAQNIADLTRRAFEIGLLDVG